MRVLEPYFCRAVSQALRVDEVFLPRLALSIFKLPYFVVSLVHAISDVYELVLLRDLEHGVIIVAIRLELPVCDVGLARQRSRYNFP